MGGNGVWVAKGQVVLSWTKCDTQAVMYLLVGRQGPFRKPPHWCLTRHLCNEADAASVQETCLPATTAHACDATVVALES